MNKQNKQLIEEQYTSVNKKVQSMVNNQRWLRHVRTVPNIANDITGFLPEAVKSLDKNKIDTKNIPHYLARICIYRFIDHSRRYKILYDKPRQFSHLLNAIDEKLLKTTGYISDIAREQLINKGFKGSKRILRETMVRYHTVPLKDVPIEQISYVDEDVVQWEDLKDAFLAKVYKDFGETYTYFVMRDYLIPEVEGKEHKTLVVLSKEYGISSSRLSQIMKDKKIKKLLMELIC